MLKHGDQHLSGEGLSVGLSSGLFSESDSQFSSASISSSTDVAAAIGPHGVNGAVCSPGSLSDVPASVVSQGLLVSDDRRSFSAGSSVSGV